MNLDWRLIQRAGESRLALALTIGLGLAGGVLAVFQARTLSRVIQRVFLAGEGLGEVSFLLALLLAAIVLRAGLIWGSEAAASAIAIRVKTKLRQQLFKHIQDLGPAYAGGERTGELTSATVEGIEALDAYYSQYLPQLALAALVPLTFLVFILPLDLLTGVVLLVTAPLIPLFMILIGNQAAALTGRQWRTLSRMSAYFLDVMQGLTALKILGRSRDQIQVIAQVSDRFRQTTMSVLQVTFVSTLALELVSTLSTAVVAVEIGLRLLYGRLSFEQAFFVLVLAPEFYLPLRMLGTRFHAGMKGAAAAKRIFTILETAVEDAGQKPPDCFCPPYENHPPDESSASFVFRPSTVISFEDVHYAYSDDRAALKGVSFDIEAGQQVALVGPSGAGKSTLASLLLRFISPGQGKISVGGQALGMISPAVWRTQLAWVSQQPYLFNDTLAANIGLARPEAGLEEIIRAARLAQADEFIQDLPRGYNTLVGEGGARLSGGQAQRIALARAFLKDAPLLVLDEATANLDPENETRLQAALDRLLAGRTALIIAHRLSTVRQADRIIVLDGGRVIETGSHTELMDLGGLYRRLVTAYGEEGATACSGQLTTSATGTSPTSTNKNRSSLALPLPALPGQEREGMEEEKGGDIRAPLLRLMALVAPFKGLVALSALVGFFTVASSIGLMMASAYIISAAALQPSISQLQVAIVGVRFFGLTRGLFRYLERFISHQVTFRLLARLRVWFYKALEPLAPARLLDYRSGDLLARILGDIESLENFYVRVLAPPLVAVLVALVMGLLLSGYDPSLGMALLAFLLAAGVGTPLLARAAGREAGRRLVGQRAALIVALVDGIQGLADLLVCGAARRQFEHVVSISRSLAAAQQHMARIGGLQSALVSLLSYLGMWAVLALAIPLVESGQIQGVYLAGLALGALASFEAVLPLPLAAQYLESNLEAARRLFEVVDARPEVRDPPDPLPLPADFGLEAREVGFHYPVITSPPQAPSPGRFRGGKVGEKGRVSPTCPGDDEGLGCFAPVKQAQNTPSLPLFGRVSALKPGRRGGSERSGILLALKDIQFSLPQGKWLAVVGPSGAGKSTLVNLLLRFWEYDEGEILLGGKDLRRYDQDELRRVIGVVSQKTYLFNASLRENLLIARPKASQAEIIQAAEGAQIHEFILGLPEGYDTWIGERGMRLSAGERQRLAIGRALLKNAPVLILDEATANLDTLTERRLLISLQRLMEGRTTLMVTHRLVGMETMNEILVLQGGCVAERGSHAELLEMGGLYRRMWDLQHQRLADDLPDRR